MSEHPNTIKDRDNLSYWRYPTRRMEAEAVRDSVLACAGALDRSVGGPELDVADWINKPRRSLYFTQHGESQMLFLSTFDGANVCDCYRRTATVLPTQALAMTNSELMIHYGRVAAEHLMQVAANSNVTADSAAGADQPADDSGVPLRDRQFVSVAFESLLGREPSSEEMRLSVEFLVQQSNAIPKQVEEPKLPAGLRGPSSDSRQRARENFVIALFNHNDFVTVR